jgi:SAM-dependent methyltransferase
MKDRSNWFEDFFHGIVNDLWRQAIPAKQTSVEVDFLEKQFGRKGRVLDVPCGYGRHSLELARRDHRVTGVDLSREFVAEAREAARAAKLKAEFIEGDMRRLRFDRAFDFACCLGNSFGYLEFDGMIAFVRAVAGALKPGGRFVIETGMVAESILPTLKEREWYQMDDILFAIQNRYQADVSCLETEAIFVRNGKTEVRKWWHWVYTVGEIRRLLGQAGLEISGLFGGADGQPYKAGSHELILIAEKPRRKRKQETR